MTNQTMVAWALPADISRDRLRLTLEVYEESILMRGFRQDGTVWVKNVSAETIANVLTGHLGFTSEILPAGAVWWKQGQTGKMVGLWRPPHKRTLALQVAAFTPPERYTIPLPGTLFVCSPGRAPWVYACPEYPSKPDDQLYRMPTFNVFANGRVCPGSHQFPDAVEEIPNSFFQSFFSPTADTQNRSRKHPGDLRALWRELDGQDEYPLDDLVEQCRLSEAMNISEGGAYV